MKLTVSERLRLGGLVPVMGTAAVLRSVKAMMNAMALSDEEAKTIGLTFPPAGGMAWKATADKLIPEKDVPIPPPVRQAIMNKLQTLDKEGKLLMEHLDLYERFFPGKSGKNGKREEPET